MSLKSVLRFPASKHTIYTSFLYHIPSIGWCIQINFFLNTKSDTSQTGLTYTTDNGKAAALQDHNKIILSFEKGLSQQTFHELLLNWTVFIDVFYTCNIIDAYDCCRSPEDPARFLWSRSHTQNVFSFQVIKNDYTQTTWTPYSCTGYILFSALSPPTLLSFYVVVSRIKTYSNCAVSKRASSVYGSSTTQLPNL